MAAPRADVAGQRFGRLTAIIPLEEKLNGRTVWACRCDCGQPAQVTISALRKGDTRSCGCLRRESGRANLAAGRALRNAR